MIDLVEFWHHPTDIFQIVVYIVNRLDLSFVASCAAREVGDIYLKLLLPVQTIFWMTFVSAGAIESS